MENTLAGTKKVNTGIEGFDKLTFGGLPQGRSYLIAGEPGTGKTIFSLQYLLTGAKQGETCIYISIDESPAHVIEDAQALGWNIKPYLEKGTLKIIDITQYFSATQDKDGNTLDVTRIVNTIIDYIKENNATRLAIDPIAPLIFSDKQITNVVEYIRSLILKIETLSSCTTLLTSYIPVGSNKVSCFGIEEFASSGIITLKLITQNNKRIRCIGVRKMRGTRIDLSEYSFDILHTRGITLRQAL